MKEFPPHCMPSDGPHVAVERDRFFIVNQSLLVASKDRQRFLFTMQTIELRHRMDRMKDTFFTIKYHILFCT